ncbi:hypothetical protein ASPSYDRAFT_52147 [Aspergillus sydowii CBS 593.65]|uniref:Hypervirulence associated protein TUDOR domain-containing protein n=1 Tax=Aspergillus sydowii CBS 593.65 TaxID=1036612 RepID=A0A1L9SYL3_9EURO|nr:uncharacterized protein ASPSYDRAFT_52147 [Aspergillus sydowii CBS 593.65]OJJ52259.1 hypothetical protein ASPSYDRAFT_52147 [Aspergillus sydowii CBS 593.65]
MPYYQQGHRVQYSLFSKSATERADGFGTIVNIITTPTAQPDRVLCASKDKHMYEIQDEKSGATFLLGEHNIFGLKS